MAAERFENALRGVPQAVPPVWFMRQAGRYHSHYRRLRDRHSFEELCRRPELAAEVALGPIRDFDFDVAILFSDLLFPLEALGFELRYDDSGPQLGPRLDAAHLRRLRLVREAVERLRFQQAALEATRAALAPDKSLIGFVGGPWTLFVYACEGRHDASQAVAKSSGTLFREFCDRLVPLLVESVRMQVEGGAELVMIFDTAAGGLAPSWFQRVALPAAAPLVSACPGKVGYYALGVRPAHYRTAAVGDASLDGLVTRQLPLAGVGVDAGWSLGEALQLLGASGFVQGNFDQTLLTLPPDPFREALEDYFIPLTRLDPRQRRGWVCGLGHGVPPTASPNNVRTFVQMVREVFA